MEQGPKASASVEATLSAYSERTRALVVPMLLYKHVFMGDWYQAILRNEPDPEMRNQLLTMSHATLRESLELLATMREWDSTAPTELSSTAAASLQRLALYDLLAVKEGNNEALVLAAMRAPTDSLRQKVLALADLDRMHADQLRKLLGADAIAHALERRRRHEGSDALGAHEHANRVGTLSGEVRERLGAMRRGRTEPRRIIVSHVALRRLRDEGAIKEDGTAFGLPVDLDLGWQGACYSIATGDRVRLSELLSLGAERLAPEPEAQDPKTADER